MESNIHVLIIAQFIEPFLPFIEELQTRNVTLGICDSLAEALKYVARHSPQIVMISYNHQSEPVKESAKILERRFNVQCVAICERKTKNTAKILLQSGLKHMIFPPVTADAIFDKVMRMMRDKNRDKNKKTRSLQSELPLKALFEDDSLRANSAQNLFAQPPPKIERVHDLSLPKAQEKPSNRAESKTWFLENVVPGVEQAIKSMVINPQDILDEHYVGVPVRTFEFTGMVIIPLKGSQDQIVPVAENFCKDLRRRQGNMGKSCYCGDPIELKFTTDDWARMQGASVDRDEKVILFDVNSEEPKYRTSRDNKILTIDMNVIDLSVPLTFNLYIHLPKNKKFYSFARRGRLISAKRIERLNLTEHELFIQKTDLKNFRSYYFKNIILKTALLKSLKAA